MTESPLIVDVAALTRCEVRGDGAAASLGMMDSAGMPVRLHINLEQVSALLMTLPRLLQQLLRSRHADPTLRLVYPVRRWTLEQATDGRSLILSLTTPDGFAASFALPPSEFEEMAALCRAAEASVPARH